MTDNGDESTVAAIDIARLARVGKAAVSNWRRRFEDFPSPVGGTPANPLYSLSAVEGWLTEHGKRVEATPGERVWQSVQNAVVDLRLGSLVGMLTAFVVFTEREPDSWRELSGESDDTLTHGLPRAVSRAIPELPSDLPETLPPSAVTAVRAVADLASELGSVPTVEYLCERYSAVFSRRNPNPAPELAALMSDLAGAGSGGDEEITVLNPACGFGTLLLAAHHGSARRYLGQDLDADFATITATRMLLRPGTSSVASGDSLTGDAFPDVLADIVLCRPPLGTRSWGDDSLANDPRWEYGLPPRGEPELAWLQHCLAHARPGRTVVMAMPPGAATRRAGRRIRGNLLRAGALRAVIRVAAGQRQGDTTDLWVLRRPEPDSEPPTRMLVYDDTVGESTTDTAVLLAWRDFDADEDADLPKQCRAPRLIDLLDDEIDVSPGRHVAPAARQDAVAHYPVARNGLANLAGVLAGAAPALAAPAEPTQFSSTTLGELAKAGALVIHQSPIRMQLGAGERVVLTSKDVTAGRTPTGRTADASEAVPVEQGDVVTPATPHHLVVRVAAQHEEGAVLGPHLMLFRVVPERLDPYFLAGFLRAAGASGTLTSSRHSLRIDPRRASVPLLPLAEQRRYGEAFRELFAVESTARELAETAATLVRGGIDGLASGGLTPGGDE